MLSDSSADSSLSDVREQIMQCRKNAEERLKGIEIPGIDDSLSGVEDPMEHSSLAEESGNSSLTHRALDKTVIPGEMLDQFDEDSTFMEENPIVRKPSSSVGSNELYKGFAILDGEPVCKARY